MKKILMCPPNSFNINYEINPWMVNNISSVDSLLAYKQWKHLYDKISLSTPVIQMEEKHINIPDIVFTANAGVVIDNIFIPSKFAHRERQPETDEFINEFKNLGFEIDSFFVESGTNFEGAGDALFSHKHKKLIMGYGFRTSIDAPKYISKFLKNYASNYDVLDLELVDPSFYHLDTCFCPLDNGMILFYPSAFSFDSLKLLNESFGKDLIAVSHEDAKSFACNAVSIGSNLLVNSITSELKHYLNSLNISVIETPMSEFMKSGGSCKCLTINIHEKIVNA